MQEMNLSQIAERHREVLSQADKEMSHGVTENKHYKDKYFSMLEKLNYLSFIIVGAVLALNQSLHSNIYVQIGCIIILTNAVYCYYHVSQYYRYMANLFKSVVGEFQSAIAKVNSSYNNFLRTTDNVPTDKQGNFDVYQESLKEFLNWQPSKAEEFKTKLAFNAYFFSFALGLLLIGIGISVGNTNDITITEIFVGE